MKPVPVDPTIADRARSRRFILRDVLGWGVLLWLIGYILGIAFYAVVPTAVIGWYVMPIGVAMTALVLWKWVPLATLRDGVVLGLGWSAIAIVGDYVFIVKLLTPPDGYYKPDVALYYLLTLALPVAVAVLRRRAAGRKLA
jgi:hypothetical protein